MQIQLKQNEIEAALRGYIGQKGIELSGKSVAVTFKAGRKGGGLSAELVIENQADGVQTPVVDVIKAAVKETVEQTKVYPQEAEDSPADAVEEARQQEPASLFG